MALASEPSIPAPRIAGLTVSGPGCPSASEFSIAATREDFFADLSAYLVAGSADAESACSVQVILEAQDGVSYSPAGLEIDLSTDATSTVTLMTMAFWTSDPEFDAQTHTRISSRGWRTTQTVLDEEELWSACEGLRALHIDTRLKLKPAGGRLGYAGVHALHGLRFRSKRCGGGAPSPIDAGTPEATPDGSVDGGDAGTVAPPTDPSTNFWISRVSTGGGGCARDRTDVVIAEDKKSFELRTQNFVADSAAASPVYRHCAVFVYVAAPPGYRTVIDSFTAEGTMNLAAGAEIELGGRYWYASPGSPTKDASFRYRGAQTGSFSAEFRLGSFGASASSCDLNPSVSFDARSTLASTGALRVDVARIHAWKVRVERCR